SKTCFTSGSDTVRGAVGAEDLAKVCQWEFVTGEDGRPVHEVGKDRKGNIVWGLVYAPSKADDTRADTSGLPEWKRRACVHFVDAKGYPQKQRKDLAEYIEITYDTEPGKEGLERLIEYRDSVGNRVAGVDGAWAREYTHDAEGREASLFSKKWSEQDGRYVNMIDRAGNSGMTFEYDDNGDVRRGVSVGVDGEPMPVVDGYSEVRYSYDRWGNVESGYYYRNGSPCFHRQGHHCIRRSYDEHGAVSSESYQGVDGAPVVVAGGFAEVRMEKDPDGNITRMAYFGPDGAPCLHSDGIHGWSAEYDPEGNETVRTYFDKDGSPVNISSGYARSKQVWEGGRLKEWACFGTGGEPAVDNTNGTHRTCREYDSQGYQARETYYGPDGKPCLHKEGNHGWEAVYDCAGNETRRTFFGLDGNPILLSDGYATVRNEYDQNGNVMRRTYYSSDGSRCLHKEGSHGWKAQYNFQGRQTELAFFGVSGEAVALDSGYARIEVEYDREGRRVRESYYGTDGKRCMHTGGFSEGRAEYDHRGKMIRAVFYGTDGDPCIISSGIHGWSSTYNERGKEVERCFFGLDGKPIALEDGYAIFRTVWDAQGRQIEWSCYDAEGNPAVDKRDGTHKVVTEYDGLGRKSRERYYGVDGKPCESHEECVQTEYSYDEEGESNESASQGLSDREMRVPFIAEVVDGGAAQKAGIKKCDLVMVYQDWSLSDLVDDPEMKKFESAMDGAVADEKRVVVWDGEEFKSFTLPAGMIGIRVMDRPMSAGEHRALWKAFLKWLDEVTADSDGEAAE
ncbi:MAG TPA: hypothetical protein P5069_09075, partial [Candidatus Hydrogenedentes bacterium]|nr:hypothetical protein [Candidatus Hydrogenedentota bacterium]